MRTLLTSAMAATMLLSVGAASSFAADEGMELLPRKVAICHVTGSKKKPVVKITIAAQAVPSHVKHGDFFPNDDGKCPL